MERVLYVVGGPPRVGKSALGRRVMERHQVPWLSTDILRSVLRTVDPGIDEVDRGHADPDRVAGRMFPYLERAVDVALEHCELFLIEGVEWLPGHRAVLADGLKDVSIRACFLGNLSFSDDHLTSYRGPNRWHDGVPGEERQGLPEWIRRWSDPLRGECAEMGEPYVDVGQLGFHEAMAAAELSLIGEAPDL